MKYLPVFFILLLFTSCKMNSKKEIVSSNNKKVVIAHRGASGYLPEHTLEAKILAFGMDVDYIEQDLVLSKDDIPIVIHDIHLDEVTNVADIYFDRKRKDGRYYVIDFTFDELKTLTVSERFHYKTGNQVFPNRFPIGKGKFKLHSLQEELELITTLNKISGKNIGIYPEIKNPQFHLKHGKDISKIILPILADFGYSSKKDNCILQCFDAKELERIRKELKSQLFLVQLIESPQETLRLKHFSSYADGIGPWYKLILSEKVDNRFTFTSLIENAHKLEMVVHPYTFRADYLGEFDSFKQMVQVIIFEANADGGFTDFPDLMLQVIKQW